MTIQHKNVVFDIIIESPADSISLGPQGLKIKPLDYNTIRSITIEKIRSDSYNFSREGKEGWFELADQLLFNKLKGV